MEPHLLGNLASIGIYSRVVIRSSRLDRGYFVEMLKFDCRENIKTTINCLGFFILCTYRMLVGLVAIILVVFVCDCFTLHVRHACMEPHLVGNLASIGMHRWVVIMNSRLGCYLDFELS